MPLFFSFSFVFVTRVISLMKTGKYLVIQGSVRKENVDDSFFHKVYGSTLNSLNSNATHETIYIRSKNFAKGKDLEHDMIM